MRTATAPSPFTRAVDPSPVPDRFLPGDGASIPGVPSHFHPRKQEESPRTSPDFEDTREAVRAAEDRLARIRAEEEVLSQRRNEILAFQKQADAFHADVASSLAKLQQLEENLAEDGADARRCSASIHRTIHILQGQLEKIDRVHPEEWTKSRMKAEMDHALDLLADVEHETQTEMKRLERELPKRMKRLRDGWLRRSLYWMTSAFAFMLPLLAFVAIAVILVLTALGLV